jgi:hypothetical protein
MRIRFGNMAGAIIVGCSVLAFLVALWGFYLDPGIAQRRDEQHHRWNAFIERCESMGGLYIETHTGFGGFGSTNQDCRFPQ